MSDNTSPSNCDGAPSAIANRRADCYAASERRVMELSQCIRGRATRPLLRLLDVCRVSPDQITGVGLVAGLAFCPLYFWHPLAAFAALGLHVLLDGLDGPLARYQRIDSPRGSFTDTVTDQIVIVATTIALMLAGDVSIPAGGAYIFHYTAVIAFAMIRNALAVPYSWLFRPRFLVYAWLLVEWSLWPGSLEYLVWGCNLLLVTKMVTGFIRIRSRM